MPHELYNLTTNYSDQAAVLVEQVVKYSDDDLQTYLNRLHTMNRHLCDAIRGQMMTKYPEKYLAYHARERQPERRPTDFRGTRYPSYFSRIMRAEPFSQPIITPIELGDPIPMIKPPVVKKVLAPVSEVRIIDLGD